MTSKVVVYDRFLACRDFTYDEFWKGVFYNCGCNKFPRDVRYDHVKNVLHAKYVRHGCAKSDVYDIPDDSHKLYTLLMHVFNELIGMRSEFDIQMSIDELETLRKSIDISLDCEWKKLKPRTLRNQFIMTFASSQIEEHGLNPELARHLYNKIQLGFQFKKLSNDDVVYEKGVIESISGLEFDDAAQRFVITHVQKSMSREKTPVRSSKLNQHMDRWIRDYKSQQLVLN